MRQRLPQWWPHDRRKAQGGSTLVELLVTVVIIGLALTLIVGTFSAGLLQSAIAKRNTAASGAVQYELDEVAAAPYGSLPAQYSDCFADEDAASPPTTLAAFQGNCPTSAYSLRVDVSEAAGPVPNTEVWSISAISLPSGASLGTIVQTIKDSR